jgi:hypothetical protein
MSNLVTSSNRSGSALADAADVESGECLTIYSYVNSVRYCTQRVRSNCDLRVMCV